MLNSILEYRALKDGLYSITLIINEKDYFKVYDDITQENAQEIVDNYLLRRQDDGRPGDVQIRHNKQQRIVSIGTNLHYEGNEKTTYHPRTHDYIN